MQFCTTIKGSKTGLGADAKRDTLRKKTMFNIKYIFFSKQRERSISQKHMLIFIFLLAPEEGLFLNRNIGQFV